MQNNILTLRTLYYLFIPFAAGAFGALFQPGDWYRVLHKPDGTPPDAVFPIVWNALYLLMGIAAVLVARRAHPVQGVALALFHVQLLLNALWPWLFFGLEQPAWALADQILLDLAVIATILVFTRVRPLAATLLLPYLAWVLYATYLNAGIVALN